MPELDDLRGDFDGQVLGWVKPDGEGAPPSDSELVNRYVAAEKDLITRCLYWREQAFMDLETHRELRKVLDARQVSVPSLGITSLPETE